MPETSSSVASVNSEIFGWRQLLLVPFYAAFGPEVKVAPGSQGTLYEAVESVLLLQQLLALINRARSVGTIKAWSELKISFPEALAKRCAEYAKNLTFTDTSTLVQVQTVLMQDLLGRRKDLDAFLNEHRSSFHTEAEKYQTSTNISVSDVQKLHAGYEALTQVLYPRAAMQYVWQVHREEMLTALTEPNAALPDALIEYNVHQLVSAFNGFAVNAPASDKEKPEAPARAKLLHTIAETLVDTVFNGAKTPSLESLTALLPLAAMQDEVYYDNDKSIARRMLQATLRQLEKHVLLDTHWLDYLTALLRYATPVAKPAKAKVTPQKDPTPPRKQEVTPVSTKPSTTVTASCRPCLDNADVLRLLTFLLLRLQQLHVDRSSHGKLLALLTSLNQLFDTLVDRTVEGLDMELTRSLRTTLETIQKDNNIHPDARSAATYAIYALAQIPKNNTVLKQFFGPVYQLGQGVVSIVCAAQSVDVGGIIAGIVTVLDVAKQFPSIVKDNLPHPEYPVLRFMQLTFTPLTRYRQ